jgi:WD40 repeat protein
MIGRISAIAVSPDGKRLAVGGERPAPILVDVASGTVTRRMTGGHEGGIRSVRFDPKGQRLVTAGGDRRAIIWDVGTGERILEFRQPGNDDFNEGVRDALCVLTLTGTRP